VNSHPKVLRSAQTRDGSFGFLVFLLARGERTRTVVTDSDVLTGWYSISRTFTTGCSWGSSVWKHTLQSDTEMTYCQRTCTWHIYGLLVVHAMLIPVFYLKGGRAL